MAAIENKNIVIKVNSGEEELGDPNSSIWSKLPEIDLPMIPAPLKGNPGIKRISPFIEKSTDHGTIKRLKVKAAHNGNSVAFLMRWENKQNDKIVDLDDFVDGAAIMFPLTPKASAITMGSPTDPVNAWYWKANIDSLAFDVVAEGYGTSGRSTPPSHPINCAATYEKEHWHLVLMRNLTGEPGKIQFHPGQQTRFAFALWDGQNKERSGRKSFSGDFITGLLQP